MSREAIGIKSTGLGIEQGKGGKWLFLSCHLRQPIACHWKGDESPLEQLSDKSYKFLRVCLVPREAGLSLCSHGQRDNGRGVYAEKYSGPP